VRTLLINPDYNFFRRDYWFGRVDSRPLSVFRIGFSLFLLKDALSHIALANLFYSDAGVLPRQTLMDVVRPEHFSLMEALSTEWMAAAFFILWTVVVLCLLLGYRTRLMSILNFVIVLSIHERNVYVLTGGDTVLRVMCFWMMFIPLDHHYALDAVRRRWSRYRQTRQLRDLRFPAAGYTAYAFPVRMIMIQVALVYIFTIVLKLQGSQWLNGQAVGYVFQVQAMMVPLGRWFGSVAPDWLFRILTYQTLMAEAGFAIFMFSPFLQPSLRVLGLFFVIGLHLGIGLMMTQPLPDFSLVMFASYLVFFEGRWYAALDAKLRATRQQSTMRLPTEGSSPAWLLLAVTSESDIAVASVLEANGGSDTRTLLGHLPLSRLWGFLLRLAPGQAIVRGIARLITAIIRRDPLPLPVSKQIATTDELSAREGRHRVGRVALTLALAGVMISVIWWNIDATAAEITQGPSTMPQTLRNMVLYSGVWQYWDMFAPIPLQQDGWIVIPGTFEDGTTMDVRTRQPYTTALPDPIWGPEMRWQKFDENLNANRFDSMLRAMGSYYCGTYNNVEALPVGKRLKTLEIHYLMTPSHAPGEPANTQQDTLLWTHFCFE